MERRGQISVPVDQSVREAIEHVAQLEERTIAQQVRRWIAEGLARAAEQAEGMAA